MKDSTRAGLSGGNQRAEIINGFSRTCQFILMDRPGCRWRLSMIYRTDFEGVSSTARQPLVRIIHALWSFHDRVRH